MRKKIYHKILVSFVSSFLFLSNLKGQEVSIDTFKLSNITGDYFGCKTPGSEPELFCSDIFKLISGDRIPHCLVFSDDLNQASFVIIDKGRWVGTIMYIKKINNKWLIPYPLPLAENSINTDPYFSSDGDKLYFTAYYTKESDNPDFYYVKTNDLSQLFRLNYPINSDSIEWTFSISKKNEIYFSSARKGTKGRTDIYSSTIKNDEYSIPNNLKTLNSPVDDDGAVISPCGDYLLFNTLNTENKKFEIFVSFKVSLETWSSPIRLGDEINNGDLNYRPYITSDGKYLFFNRRKEDNIKIFWVSTDIISKLKLNNNILSK